MGDDGFLESRNFYFWRADVWGGRLRGSARTKKRIILFSFILILGIGLFFSVHFDEKAYAKQVKNNDRIDPEVADPLNRINKGLVSGQPQKAEKICAEGEKKSAEEKQARGIDEDKIREMVGGHPIKEMAGEISKRDEKTAAFLVAIARKESSWGLHAPHIGGRDCFNYWGYKGNYNLVLGYSCFDSPEQAVAVVGDRIKSLVDKKIDTPARMLVWKCGSSCAGHDPGGVKKWVADVSQYFYRLSS